MGRRWRYSASRLPVLAIRSETVHSSFNARTMPELPEVETIRRDLSEKIIGKKIVGVWTERGKFVRLFGYKFLQKDTPNVGPACNVMRSISGRYTTSGVSKESFFERELIGKSFAKIERVGKLLMFEIVGSGKWLLVHLKMTGQLIYLEGKNVAGGPAQSSRLVAGGHSFSENDFDLPNKHTRIVFSFPGGAKLFFNDMRKFGYARIVNEKERQKIIDENFGMEPGAKDFKLDDFRKIFRNRKTSVKACLLNQKLIAGIGNIYADEACFAAGIKPGRRANSLAQNETEKLFCSVEKVIKKAILKRGTTFNNYRDGEGRSGNFEKFLKVYGRGGEKCKQCGQVLKKGKVAGRGTVWCEHCQK